MSTNRMLQVIAVKAFTALAPDADKRTVISALAEALARHQYITPEQLPIIIDEALRRETVGSTGIGHGIAIPHCRTPLVSEIMCSYGHWPGKSGCRTGFPAASRWPLPSNRAR